MDVGDARLRAFAESWEVEEQANKTSDVKFVGETSHVMCINLSIAVSPVGASFPIHRVSITCRPSQNSDEEDIEYMLERLRTTEKGDETALPVSDVEYYSDFDEAHEDLVERMPFLETLPEETVTVSEQAWEEAQKQA